MNELQRLAILERQNIIRWEKPEMMFKRAFRSSRLIQDISYQLSQNYSVLLLIVGRPRTAKTWKGLSIASLFDPHFRKEPKMYFSIKDFAQDMRIGIEKGYLFYNKVFLIDEVGKDLDYREYASDFNKVFSYLLQTQQIMNKLFIIVLPHAKLLAKAHHYFVNYLIETKTREKVQAFKVLTRYSDMVGKEPYLVKLETIEGLPLPPPNVIEWFYTFEKTRKMDMGLEIIDSLNKKKKNDFEGIDLEKIFGKVNKDV